MGFHMAAQLAAGIGLGGDVLAEAERAGADRLFEDAVIAAVALGDEAAILGAQDAGIAGRERKVARLVEVMRGGEFEATVDGFGRRGLGHLRSEEHTSELQSLMRISYAVFCLKKKNKSKNT